MMLKKVFAAVFAAIGLVTAALAVFIGMNFTDRAPTLLTPPTVARSKQQSRLVNLIHLWK